MADEAATKATTEEKAETTEDAKSTDWKAEARKWEKRARANAKALEEAKATQVDDANSNSEKLAKANARIKELEAEQERDRAVRKIAKDTGVDADVLLRMQGSTEQEIKENAEVLSKALKAKWPTVPDDGGSKKSSKRMSRDEILAIRDPVKQMQAALENPGFSKS